MKNSNFKAWPAVVMLLGACLIAAAVKIIRITRV